MIAVTYQIRLEEPAILKALDGDPNSAVSFDYIPGSVIRGMIISQYIRDKRAKDPDFELHADGEEQFIFFSSQTRYLNAYPVIEGQRSLPVPGTWMQPKYEKTDNILDTVSREQTDDKNPVKRKGVSGFVTIRNDEAYIYKPQTVINVHNTRTRTGDSRDQQVFRYEALAEGQTFAGAILCPDEQTANSLKALMDTHKSGYIGRSRTAGYGRVSLKDIQVDAKWTETPAYQVADGDSTVMTFISDTLLRDEFGVYYPSPEMLQMALAAIGVECIVEPIAMKTTWVGGFNRKWGLPLPQTIGIASGSVVRLTGLKADANIAYLLEHGLGDRREDGFGRVVLGWQREQLLKQRKVKYQPSKIVVREKVELSEESRKLLEETILLRMREEQLDNSTSILFRSEYSVVGQISRTQIAYIRNMIANELRKEDPSTSFLTSYVHIVQGKKSGRSLEATYIGKQSMIEWLQSPDFEKFGRAITKKDRYVLQLMDVVLERAYRAREKQEKS